MTGLLTAMRYDTVVYMTAPAARRVVLSAETTGQALGQRRFAGLGWLSNQIV
jgi:hypothetical protein